ncbi:MAG: flavodoxin domain-containing protein [Chloroflexi bacterium]|nr:flavodoxin domain-containing protein [Chloroflexota bacterium]
MSASVLVGYATTYGSTRQVAEQVAAAMRDSGLEVAVEPVKQVQSLANYRAIVLGAPLYMFHWHKDATRFLSRHRDALMTRPVAVFALGPINATEKEFTDARAQLDKELAKFAWLAPVSIEVFGGKLDPAGFRFPHNLIPALKKLPPSDIRDWQAIRNWANDLAAKIKVTVG